MLLLFCKPKTGKVAEQIIRIRDANNKVRDTLPRFILLSDL